MAAWLFFRGGAEKERGESEEERERCVANIFPRLSPHYERATTLHTLLYESYKESPLAPLFGTGNDREYFVVRSVYRVHFYFQFRKEGRGERGKASDRGRGKRARGLSELPFLPRSRRSLQKVRGKNCWLMTGRRKEGRAKMGRRPMRRFFERFGSAEHGTRCAYVPRSPHYMR